MKFGKSKRNKLLLVFIFLNLLFYKFTNVNSIAAEVNNDSILFIAENTADNILALDLAQEFNLSSDIRDIKPSENLNDLFLKENYLNKYSIILMTINRISIPLNDTLVSNLENFTDNGGIFVIVSTQIWKFPSSFHELLGISINPGQKEWPSGNVTQEITLTIVNDTYSQTPYKFENNSVINLSAGIGIINTIDKSDRVAISQNTPVGNMSINAFRKNKGFIIVSPISLISFSSTSFTHFLTSVLTSGYSYVIENRENSRTKSNPFPPIIPFFNISESTVQAGVVIGSTTAFILGLIYVLKKISTQIVVESVPKDRSWLYSIILGPILWIGHIVYPPVLRKLDTTNVYENDTRKSIIDILEERDFLHFRELKRELNNIGTSSLRWHLQVLEDFRIIKRQVFGQYEIYYLLEHTPNHNFLELYFTIISGLGFRIGKAFNQNSSWDLNALADYLETSKESIRYHCKKFEKINLLEMRNGRLILNPNKKELLKEVLYRRNKCG